MTMALIDWLRWRWHLVRFRQGRWELHSYGCDVCEDR